MGFGTLTNDWKVDDSPIYAPSKRNVKFEHDNITTSDTGRVESGDMHIRWVKRDVRTITLQWDILTGKEVEYLYQLFQGQEFTFHFKHFGRAKSMSAYCGKLTYDQDSEVLYEEEGGLYRNINLKVVEKLVAR